MGSGILRKNKIEGFTGFLIYWISLFILFLYFALSLYFALNLKAQSIFFKIFSALTDSLIFSLPYILIKGRWRYSLLFIPFLMALIIWANLLYFRNFQDLIPSSLYFHSQIGDSTVSDSILPSSKLSDIILIIAPFLPIIFLCVNKNIIYWKPKKYFLIGYFVVLACCWGVTFAGSYRRIGIYNQTNKPSKILENLFPAVATDWTFYYHQHNFSGYLFRTIFKSELSNHKLSNEEKEYLNLYFAEKKNRIGLTQKDSIEKNLIFIVVESLPMKVFSIEGKEKIMPNLNRLVNDPSVIFTRSEVIKCLGRSSDAQFIYNTGLLPLKYEPVVTNHSTKDYPSIAKALGYESLEVIGERGNLWSHKATTKSYGFDSLISDIATVENNQDSIIFSYALNEIKRLNQPLFLFISTLSMHDPYTSERVSQLIDPSELRNFSDPRDREYFQRLSYFDMILGNFLSELKKIDRYDNSVIVIMGDHDIRNSTVSKSLHDNSVPMIIINSGREERYRTQTNQTSLFPTLLDIFDINYSYQYMPYSGVGKSIFVNPDEVDNYPSEEDFKVSELMIKGVF